MANKIKTQNFLSGVISDSTPATYDGGIPSSGDFSVRLSSVPTYTKGFLVLDQISPSTRESVYFHDRIGDVIFVKAENRVDPKAHADGAPYQMNNSAELINYLSDNTDTFGYVEKTGGLTVNVWGGFILNDSGRVTISDTSLTLPASQTNYIYLTASNTIASTLNISEANTGVPLATVITGSTSVSTITQQKPYVTQKQGPQGIQGPVGPQGIQGIQGPAPTVPELPTYTFTGGTTDRSIDSSTATVGELFNVVSTIYEDIKDGLQGVGIVGPQGETGPQGPQGIQGIQGPPGTGDMVKATYDPANKNKQLAADDEVVKITGDQSVSGYKTFNNSIVSNQFILLRNDGDSVIFFQKDNSISRWALFKNSLQDFVLNRYDNSGAYVDNPLYVKGSNGNVGIGTNNPTEKLQVNGNIKGSNLTLRDDSLERHTGDDDDATIAFNYYGYNGGTTRFRNASFFNGKANLIFQTIGSTGKIRYRGDGSYGNGKVLTSDADGNASWTTPVANTSIGASVYRTTSYSLSTTLTAISLGVENFDTSSFHDNAVNNTRLTIPTTGVYTVGIHCSVYSSVSGAYQAYALIRKNGTTGIAGQQIDPSGSGSGGYGNLSFSTSVQLNAGDYIEVMFSKSSGVPTMSIQNTVTDFSFFIKS